MEEIYNAGNADISNIKTVEGAVAEDKQCDYTQSCDNNKDKVYGGIPEKPDASTLNVDEDGIKEYVNKDMLIGDIIAWYPDAALVLMRCGMHCITCGISQFETLDQACQVHGLETDDVAKVVNDFLTQTLG